MQMPDSRKKITQSTRDQQKKIGKGRRQRAPLKSHGQWKPAAGRSDPLALLKAQDADRLKHLLPIKYGRMLESPFTFFRGSAAVMASDLTDTSTTGIEAMLCGDAHLSNFGIFATPERRMVFDLNDFDEAFPGPWEWDLKRLAASAAIAGRDNGFGEKTCRNLAVHTVRTYIEAMDRFSRMRTLEQWYYHVNVESVLKVFEKSSKKGQKSAEKMIKKARTKTQQQTLEKLTRVMDGRRRINSDPPLLVPIREMGLEKQLRKADFKRLPLKAIEPSWIQYLDSLPDERRYLLQRYHVVDAALRVGGIGSVGTRCFIVLLEGSTKADALILQLKEAGPSVLEAHLKQRNYQSQSRRVVTAQRLMQATSDIFLGWHSSKVSGLDYYWRQLKDMKGSANVADLDKKGLETYLGVCSTCLARAHARTGNGIQIRGYLGRKNTFAKAIGKFALAYADQTEQDHEALVKAVKSGSIAAETGI